MSVTSSIVNATLPYPGERDVKGGAAQEQIAPTITILGRRCVNTAAIVGSATPTLLQIQGFVTAKKDIPEWAVSGRFALMILQTIAMQWKILLGRFHHLMSNAMEDTLENVTKEAWDEHRNVFVTSTGLERIVTISGVRTIAPAETEKWEDIVNSQKMAPMKPGLASVGLLKSKVEFSLGSIVQEP